MKYKFMNQQTRIQHLRKFFVALPDNLTVGGYLDLSGTQITALPDNLTVGGSLDLRGTQITALPDNLTVGGSLYLSGTKIEDAVYGCGVHERTIRKYNHPQKGWVVSLGCFIGTEEECHVAIRNKYSGKNADEYCEKITQAFKSVED